MPAGGNSFEFGVSGGTERSRLSRQGSRTVGALANVDLDADVVQEPLQGSVSGNTSVGNEAVTTEAAASINLTKTWSAQAYLPCLYVCPKHLCSQAC